MPSGFISIPLLSLPTIEKKCYRRVSNLSRKPMNVQEYWNRDHGSVLRY